MLRMCIENAEIEVQKTHAQLRAPIPEAPPARHRGHLRGALLRLGLGDLLRIALGLRKWTLWLAQVELVKVFSNPAF